MTNDEQPMTATPLEALKALVATEGWDWEYFCDCDGESWDGYHYENCPAWMVEVALRNAGIDVGETGTAPEGIPWHDGMMDWGILAPDGTPIYQPPDNK